jgi:ATP-binding cassette subfamily C protein LapB
MGWLVLRGLNAQQEWVVEVLNPDKGGFKEKALHDLQGMTLAKLSLAVPFESSNSPVYQLVKRELLSHKRVLAEAALAGAVLNLIALAVSFYSMQVYDRVVPTGASQTLMVLTLGVLVAAVFEVTIKHLRSHLYAHLIDNVDQRLSRAVYMRFLSLRLDQLPRSVGTLASQLRGYESVRSFLTTLTSQLMIDAPFAVLFLVLMGVIGHPSLALIPLAFLIITVSVGLFYRQKIEALTRQSVASANLKTGLLVETVEGAETIKSGQGGWRMLSRWMHTNDDARSQELQMRDITERNQHLTAFFQQVAYVLLVASGALMISKGELSMGALIACSILSGRVLQPVAMIPAQLVQWASVVASCDCAMAWCRARANTMSVVARLAAVCKCVLSDGKSLLLKAWARLSAISLSPLTCVASMSITCCHCNAVCAVGLSVWAWRRMAINCQVARSAAA